MEGPRRDGSVLEADGQVDYALVVNLESKDACDGAVAGSYECFVGKIVVADGNSWRFARAAGTNIDKAIMLSFRGLGSQEEPRGAKGIRGVRASPTERRVEVKVAIARQPA